MRDGIRFGTIWDLSPRDERTLRHDIRISETGVQKLEPPWASALQDWDVLQVNDIGFPPDELPKWRGMGLWNRLERNAH